jgi:orotate phosphoribosyltransferase
VPLFSLVQMSVPSYEGESCPLCAKGLPVVKPGSRAL